MLSLPRTHTDSPQKVSDLWTLELIELDRSPTIPTSTMESGETMSTATPARPSGGARPGSESGDRDNHAGIHRSPVAQRQRNQKAWKQPKFLVGAALVVVSVVVGATLVGSADQRVLVWSAARDLAPGTVLTSDDLIATPVQSELVDRYIGTNSEDLVGRSLGRPIGANELVPVSAIGTGRGNTRLITVPVEPIHAPTDLAHGDLVDVYVSPRDAAMTGGVSRLALAGVSVAQVEPDVDSATGEIAVVLEVGADQTAEVVGASRGGVLDLVRVPISSQVASG